MCESLFNKCSKKMKLILARQIQSNAYFLQNIYFFSAFVCVEQKVRLISYNMKLSKELNLAGIIGVHTQVCAHKELSFEQLHS